jgi:hypothetical protein
MENDNKRKTTIKVSLPLASTSDLKGKQSVRATFRLTGGCIDAISIVAAQLGIKQKSLFDHLAEDIQSLESIARKIKNKELKKQNRTQKTFVISRRSLSSLDEISKLFNAPRDVLVEHSIQRLLPIINKEREKHEKRKVFLARITNHFKEGEKILNDIKKQLGDDDPIINKFEMVMSGYKTAKGNIKTFIDRGKSIEDFDSDTMSY